MLQFGASGLHSQCNTDSQCPTWTSAYEFRPSSPFCCDDVLAFFDHFCSGANTSLLPALSGCTDHPNCVAQPAMSDATTDPPTPTCPMPPPEKCCTRVVERPQAKLRVRFAGDDRRAISSVTLWDTTGGPLEATPSSLASASISVGTANVSMTGCFLADGPLSPTPPPPAGFEARAVVCGEAGEEVVLSFPDFLAGEGGKLAVKLCTVPAEMMAGTAATLLVKTSG